VRRGIWIYNSSLRRFGSQAPGVTYIQFDNKMEKITGYEVLAAEWARFMTFMVFEMAVWGK
jgi:hypothetical protein